MPDPLSVLARITGVLAHSRDYEETLTAIARLALPYLGSWCAVDICTEGDAMRRLAVIHSDPAKQLLARALANDWPPDRDDPLGVPVVLRTFTTVIIPAVDDELLVRVARTPEALETLRALGIGSVITVPLVARNNVLGAITFVSATAEHTYDEGDVALAEHLAALAALALDNARLHRASLGRAEAEAANKAKSDFLTTMSHEIRTPINAMLGYAELIEMGIAGPVSSQQRDFLARVRLTGKHLVGLVTHVLDLAKVEAGQLPIARHAGMTGPAVAGALSLSIPAAQGAGVRLVETNADASDGTEGVSYVGDEQRVREILINLLANAIKFTPSGGTVTVLTGAAGHAPIGAKVTGGGPWAFIRVMDTGSGIPPDQQASVFEPFIQVESGLTRTKGGSGLGLTISRRLARLMGGDITLTSSPSAGSSFTLWLPAERTGEFTIPERFEGDTAETADSRIERALGSIDGNRIYGLAEVGKHLRRRVEAVLERVAARLVADPLFPQAREMRASELEDHQLAFLTDVVQSLVVIEETGGPDSALYRDGSEIQRTVAGLHGRMRFTQGWSALQLQRESVVIAEELEAMIHQHVSEDIGDVTAAVDVIRHLVDQARLVSEQSYRQAEQGSAP